MRLQIHPEFLSVGAALLALLTCGCRPSETSTAAVDDQALEVSNHLASIATAGAPVTLDQLDRFYVEPPTGQNGAHLYLKAFDLLGTQGTNSTAHNQEILDLLFRAAEQPSSRYPVDLRNGPRTLLRHLTQFRTGAALLADEAVTQAGLGRTEAATAALLAGFRLARSLDEEPVLISKQVELACLGITLDALERSLGRGAFTAAELLRLESALQAAEQAVSLRRALLGERAQLVALFQSSNLQLAEATAMNGNGVAPHLLETYRSDGHLERDFAFTLHFMSNLVALASMSFPEALDAADRMKVPDAATALDRRLVLSAILLPPPQVTFRKGAETMARIRLARTVLGVEGSRLKRGGALPDSLEEIPVAAAHGIPRDPFDGLPLRYRLLPAGGYSVWSVGPDRKDDGGSTRRSEDGSSVDVVMAVTTAPDVRTVPSAP